jgi:hypothetical protein
MEKRVYPRMERILKESKEDNRPIILIPLASGDIYDNKGQGKEVVYEDGKPELATKRLRQGLVQIWRDTGKKPDMVINHAGYQKNSPRQVMENGRQVGLAGQLGRWIKEHRAKMVQELGVVTDPKTWSTVNEIRLGFKEVVKRYGKDEKVIVYVASNTSHIPRIMMYANIYRPKNVELRWAVARRRFTPKDSLIMEPIKVGRDILKYSKVFGRLLRKKARAKFSQG